MLLLSLLTIAGYGLRYFGCLNDLWLDELISIHTAYSLHSWTQVFTSVHMDNNHYLNTLYLYLIGVQSNWSVYRFFSLACGTFTIPAAYWALEDRSRTQALLFATLIALSYPLIHFSSEARGYAAAVLAAVIAFGSLRRYVATSSAKDSVRWGVLYSATLIFGFLSHLTFLFIAAALALHALVAARNRQAALAPIVRLHIAPSLALLLLAFIDFRGFYTLGGTPSTAIHELSRLFANALGWPLHDAHSAWIIAVPLIALVAFHLSRQPRTDDSNFFLILAALLIFFAIANKPSFVAQRYFVVFVPFGYCALVFALPRMHRALATTIVALLIIGNISLYAHFLSNARGHYQAALQLVARHSSTPELRIASDQNFRAGVELDFYHRALPAPYTVRFIAKPSADAQPDWLITHDEAFAPPRPDVLTGASGKAIKVGYFGCSELSGEAWTLYRLLPNEVEPTGVGSEKH